MAESPSTEVRDDGAREAAAELVRRFRDGEEMADIFGVGERQLARFEAQAYRFYRNRRFEQAKVVGRGVLALDGERTLSRLIMGDIALEEHRYRAAVEHLEIAARLAEDHVLVRARLGEALLKGGDAGEARSHLEFAVEASNGLGDADRERSLQLLDVASGPR